MKNVRLYGEKPYTIAVVHGGPGAPGEMAPVARELSRDYGVLEPLQTKDSIDGQVEELAEVLKEYGNPPIVLVGWSYGATLGYILTAKYPALIRKLILVGATSFIEKYAASVVYDELTRLTEEERAEVFSLEESIRGDYGGDKSASLARLFRLFIQADSYDPLPHKEEVLEYQPEINERIGREVRKLLASGQLIKMGKRIRCPVAAIHGDHDPRLAEGVREPLARVLKDFRFILLEKCGHEPWQEKSARAKFYEVLKKEIA
ncbi:MAG: alpha/beta hydrolase [Dehalococcoidales bacterium]|nr:alpha/beta hydrolase [Dehalococcoidales bacterium]